MKFINDNGSRFPTSYSSEIAWFKLNLRETSFLLTLYIGLTYWSPTHGISNRTSFQPLRTDKIDTKEKKEKKESLEVLLAYGVIQYYAPQDDIWRAFAQITVFIQSSFNYSRCITKHIIYWINYGIFFSEKNELIISFTVVDFHFSQIYTIQFLKKYDNFFLQKVEFL